MKYLDEVELYSPDDPLFPAPALLLKSNAGWERNGVDRRHWKTTEPVRKIVREAFDVAGQPNYGPHAFRHMLARHAVDSAQSPAELVTTSQNLGHAVLLITLASYGQISRERQRQLATGDDE